MTHFALSLHNLNYTVSNDFLYTFCCFFGVQKKYQQYNNLNYMFGILISLLSITIN